MTPECSHCEGLGCFNATFTGPGERCQHCGGSGLAPPSTGVSPTVVKEFVEVLQDYLGSVCTCEGDYPCSAHEATDKLSGILQKLGAS